MSKQPFDDFTGGVVTPRGTVYFEDGVLIIPKQKNKKTPAVSGNHGKELDMRDLTVEERLELGNSWDNFYYCFKKRFFVVFDNNEYHIKVTAKDIINYPSSRTLVDRKVKTLEELKTVIEEAVDRLYL